MPSRTLDTLRSKFPKLRENSDEEITVALGSRFPKLAEEDPDFAKDYSLFTRNPVAGAVEDFGKSFLASAVYDTGAAGWSIVENLYKPFSAEAAKWARENADQAAKMSQRLRESGDIASDLTSASFDRGVDQDSFPSKLGSGAASLVPVVGAGAAGTLGGLGAGAITAGTAVLSGLQSFGSTYQQARKGYEDQGMSEEDAAKAAVKPAAAQGSLDVLLTAGGGVVANKLGAVDLENLALALRSKPVQEGIDSVARGSGLAQIAKGALIEGAVEEAPSAFIGSYVIARKSYDPSVTLDQSFREAWDAFLVGSTLGGLGSVPSAVSRRRKSPEEEARRQTLRDSAPRTAAKLDQQDAASEQQAAIDQVLPEGAKLDDPAAQFAEANKDVPMGGKRPVSELPLDPLSEAGAEQIQAAEDERVLEGQADLQRMSTPPDAIQLSEIAEQELERDNLTPTNRAAVNRLLDRKSEAVADSLDSSPEALPQVLEDINRIDQNIARLIPGIPDQSTPITIEQLQQLQQAYIETPTQVDAQPEQEVDQVEPEPVAEVKPLKVGGESVELDAELDSQLRGEFRKAFNDLRRQFGSMLGVRKISVVELPAGAGVASAARAGNTDTIFIDPKRLAESRNNKRFSLSKAIEEEAIHNLDVQALKSEYNRQLSAGDIDGSMSVTQYVEDAYTKVADGMTADEKASARRVYGMNFRDDVHMAQEFIRQLIQRKHTESVTEDAKRNTLIRNILEAIQRILGRAQLSGAAKQHFDQVDNFLLDMYSAEVADTSTAEERTAVEQAQQSRKPVATEEDAREDHYRVAQERIDSALRIQGWPAVGSEQYDYTRYKAILEFDEAYKAGEFVESDEGVPPLSWFKTVVSNRGKDAIKRSNAKKRGGNVEKLSIDAPVAEDSSDGMQVASKSSAAGLTPGGEGMVQTLEAESPKIGWTPMQQSVLVDVFTGNKTVTEIATDRGVTKSRISQVLKDAQMKLINYIDNVNPEFGDILSEIHRENSANAENPYAYASSPRASLIERILGAIADPKKKLLELKKFGKTILKDPLKNITNPLTGKADINLFQLRVQKDGYINKVMNVVKQQRRDLESAVSAEYGSDISQADRTLINMHLNGLNMVLKPLPERTAQAVAAMRNQIDALSRYMMQEGYIDGELKAKVEGNIGMYLARSYRIFDDADYKSNIAPEVLTSAENYIAAELMNRKPRKGQMPYTESRARMEAQVIVQDLLDQLSSEGAVDKFTSGKLGAKNLDLFKKRKTIAPEIRALMGEYTDPDVNYARTVSRMAHLIGNQKFLNDVREAGMNKIFFEKQAMASRAGIANSKITPANESYSPLAGLYTTPEVKELLDTYNETYNGLGNGMFDMLAQLNVATKSVKTVGSLMTHVRNLIGQPFFLAMSGYWNLREWKSFVPSVKAIWADAAGSDKSAQAYFNRMTELGLVGEEITTAELKRALGDLNQNLSSSLDPNQSLNKTFAEAIGKVWNKTAGTATRVYRASDELGKIMAFEMERSKLAKLPNNAGLTPKELDQKAATRVRQTMPTYSEIPPGAQFLAMQPALGPFMSFAYESIRTQVNNIKIAVEEIKNGNTSYGMQRLGGHLAVTGVYAYGFQLLSSMLGGVSGEEQDEVRSLLADYEKNSTFYFSRDEDGKINYINVSFNNPYSATTDAIMSLFGARGVQGDGSASSHIINSAAAAFDPFVSETIIAGGIIDVLRNNDSYGNYIWNPEASGTDQALDFVTHIGKLFLPGTAERAINRWFPAFKGETLESGEEPTLTKEALSEITGLRLRTIDYTDKLQRMSFANKRRINDANKIFNKVAGNRGTVSSESMISAYRSANDSRYEIFKDVQRQVQAARLGGLSDAQILNALATNGMTETDARHILAGLYRPMQISKSILKSAIAAKHPVPIGAINVVKREYNRKPINEQDE